MLTWISLTISVPKNFAPRSRSVIKTQIFHLLSSISWCLVRSLSNSSSLSLSLTPWPIGSDWVVNRSRSEREKHRGSGFFWGLLRICGQSLFVCLFFILGLCSRIWVCVLVVLVQNTLISQIWFLVFNSVFLVKINKLIFFLI